jgi:NADH-quinone oxidoreductase subunit L
MLLLIPLLPLLGFLVNAFLGKRLPKSVSGALACLAMLGSFAVSAISVWTLVNNPGPTPWIEATYYRWIASGDLQIPLQFRLDHLSSLMILVITGIGSLIHIYSTAYMHEESDSEYARYFSYLNLFAAFMLVLVLGSSFPVMFVGWEGVGLCSYLLIGFWHRKKSAADAGKKAFIVNRIGDFGFILGTLMIFAMFGTLDFQEVAARVSGLPAEQSMGLITIATLLLFLGATGKSAQIPLYTWLPDAMEGPTPVSALIHAATMVTAGVYMIGRNAVLFEHAPITLLVVAAIGIATALMAGTIGLVQNDIKRVLAYSTVSQLGYMFLAMGVGAYGAGIFHLYTHAFFKALLFLGSGAVIHALAGEQDIRNMGGLRKGLPITYWTFLIGAIAIAGVPPLAGFFSKDEILWKTFASGHRIMWIVGLVTSFLTATYMFRLVFLTFHGERRHDAPAAPAHPEEEEPVASGRHPQHLQHQHLQHPAHPQHPQHRHDHLHDAPPAMALALIVLAIGSVLAGFVGIPHALGGHNKIEAFLHPSFEAHAMAPAHPEFQVIEGRPGGQTGGQTGVRPGSDRGQASGTADPGQAAHAPASGEAHDAAADIKTERMLMALSTGIAIAGIVIAAYFWLGNRKAAATVARSATPVYALLLNKYFIDELYDAVVVQPINRLSTVVLWKGADAALIDGAVNGVGSAVRGTSSSMRRLQSGSIRAYAASLFVGVVLILGWYLTR